MMFFHAADIKDVLRTSRVTLIGALHPALRNGKPEYIAYIEPLATEPHTKCAQLMKKLAARGITAAIAWDATAHVTGTSYPPEGSEELRIIVYPARE